MNTPRVARIRVYPIKSLDTIEVAEARVLAGGGLENDRRWAITDTSGGFINAKRTAAAHTLRATFDLAACRARLWKDDGTPACEFELNDDRPQAEAWLAKHFGEPVRLLENTRSGFPDDLDASGPTIVSTASLAAVRDWMPEIATVDEARDRFRANIELDAAEAFWEDHLFGDAGQVVRFAIGQVEFEGTNPCQRCVVPTRHPRTGVATREFAKRFAAARQRNLPMWSAAARFGHFYRLSTNTRTLGRGGTIRVGDEVRVIDAPL